MRFTLHHFTRLCPIFLQLLIFTFFTAFAGFRTLPPRSYRFYFVRICHARAVVNQLPNLEHFIRPNSSVPMVLSIVLPSVEPAIPHIHSTIYSLMSCIDGQNKVVTQSSSEGTTAGEA